MSRKWRIASAALIGSLLLASSGGAKDLSAGLQKGKPDLKSAGPLAFGPDGILFIGDTQGAALFAVDTGDRDASKPGGKIRVENISQAVADLLGTRPQQVTINDVVVNPASGKAYLSVSRGQGPDASPVILRVGTDGQAARARPGGRQVRQGRPAQPRLDRGEGARPEASAVSRSPTSPSSTAASSSPACPTRSSPRGCWPSPSRSRT